MKAINRTKVAKKYAGKWVAFETNRETVVAAAPDAKTALHMAHKKGFKRPVLTHIPKTIQNFIG